jgi:hypothetical protein
MTAPTHSGQWSSDRERELQHGDSITLGTSTFLFLLEEGEPSIPSTNITLTDLIIDSGTWSCVPTTFPTCGRRAALAELTPELSGIRSSAETGHKRTSFAVSRFCRNKL